MSKIKLLRITKGISQQALAEMVGVTQGAVSQWENGTVKPRYDVLFRLAEALGCNPNDIYPTDEMTKTQRVDRNAKKLAKVKTLADDWED